LFQAITHKNAGEFRRLLIENQPCPVCGALEHPWKDHASSNLEMSTLLNGQATAQLGRVKELQSRKETLIKNSAELNKTIAHALETQRDYATSLPQAQVKLESLGNEWSALALHDILNTDMDCGFCPPLPSGEACLEQGRRGWGEGLQKSANPDSPQYKPGFSLTGTQLLPLLNTFKEQLVSALELVKSREKTVLELQKQIKIAQDLFDTTKLKIEKLFTTKK